MSLSYGCNRALPEGVRVAWGARWIAPDDQLPDRQSWHAADGGAGDAADGGGSDAAAARGRLAQWLSGMDGALSKARARSRELRLGVADPRLEDVALLFADDVGVVLGSPQGSHGYVYVAAWLFADVPGDGRGFEVTETGRVLTDADFARLADEAQEGHPDA